MKWHQKKLMQQYILKIYTKTIPSCCLIFIISPVWGSFSVHVSQGFASCIPSPGDLPNPGIKPGSPALQADSLPTELSGKPPKSTKRRCILVFSSAGVWVRLIWLDCSLKILIFEKVRRKPMVSQRLPAAASVKLNTAVHQIPGAEARGTSR